MNFFYFLAPIVLLRTKNEGVMFDKKICTSIGIATFAFSGISAVIDGSYHNQSFLENWFMHTLQFLFFAGIILFLVNRYVVSQVLATLEAKTNELNERSQMTAGLFHDMNNLLQVAMCSAEIVRRRNPEIHSVNFLEKVERSLQMISNLVQTQKETVNGKDYSRLYDLNELVREVVGLDELHLAKLNIKIEIDIPEKFEVFIAKNLFSRVILNLIKNAREALEQTEQENKIIWIKASLDVAAGKWMLSITDNGPGVDKDFQSRLFVHGQTTKQKGHGFGISSCQHAVRMFDGDITFEEPLDQDHGARFILSMPLHEEIRIGAPLSA